MNFNDKFENYWFKEGQYKHEVNTHLDMQECLKKTAKHAFDYFEPENRSLKAKLKEYELEYDNE